MTAARVLVVDDYEPFRRLISTILPGPAFHMIGQASDGLEAVQKASELLPDLILLDIGLPQLNGIEAAKRIHKIAPHSKILFVSQETSSEIVEAALSSGGLGYVFKSRIQTDLLPAIESVLAGRKFVSHGPDLRQRIEETNAPVPVRHEVLFYADEAALIESVAGFIARALRSNNPAIAIAMESHREGFARRLSQQGIDVKGAIQKGMYVALDVAELLGSIMVNGVPDSVRFLSGLHDLVASVSEAAKVEGFRLALFGESVSYLCAEGNTQAAVSIEKLCNAFLKAHPNVDILCAYRSDVFYGDARKGAYENICLQHSAVCVQ